MTLPVVAARSAAAKTVAKKTPKHAATPAKKTVAQRYQGAKAVNKKIVKSDEYKAAAGAKRSFMPKLRPAKSTVKYRQLLAMELLFAMILILTGVSDTTKTESFSQQAQQLAGLLIIFFILSAMTTAGPDAARVSAGIGGLILLTILVKQGNPLDRFKPKPIDSPSSGAMPGDNNDPNHPNYHNPGLPSTLPPIGAPKHWPDGRPIPGQNDPPTPGQNGQPELPVPA